MNSIEYPLGLQAPEPGETIALRPGLHWLRMPLPSSLKHINLWLLQDGENWTIVDCGIGSDELKALWEQVFAVRLLSGGRVRRVFATHMHSDHLGLAHWLCTRFGAELWISQGEYRGAKELLAATPDLLGPAAVAQLRRHGVADAALLETVARQPSPYAALMPSLPPTYRRIADGATIDIGSRIWRAIGGEGHSPEHMALHCAMLGVLIGGDMLLPQITTYVGVPPQRPQANPLPRYLASIDRFLTLDAMTLVLPSHGRPFVGIAARVAELHRHHSERLQQIKRLCAIPRSAAELVPQLFRRPLDQRNQVLALNETVAHLNALAAEGELQGEPGADGVLRFVWAGAPPEA